ncbi:MAG: hypothetical protein KBS54_04325 [Synergistaceae bacterium]|nr:hypothetical protein [Candidatus Equadaptatus faecalis]
MRLTNKFSNDYSVCSIIILIFYFCAGLMFVMAGASPGMVAEPEMIPDVVTGELIPVSNLPFLDNLSPSYKSELYQVALKIFSGLTVVCLSVIMILTFGSHTLRYIIDKKEIQCKDIEYSFVLSPSSCLFTWYIPALVLNIAAKWMINNQNISAEQMISDIAQFDSLLTIQTVVFVVCFVLYVLPFIIEIISAIRDKSE